MKTKQRKAGNGSIAGNWQLSPEPETFAALERIQRAWGGTMGHAVTAVLDLWASQEVAHAEELQRLVGKLHPAHAGRPLLSLPPHVFTDGLRAMDALHGEPEGRA